MKKILLLIGVMFLFSSCGMLMTTGDGIGTTGKTMSTSFEGTTNASASSTNKDKDSSWEYEE